MLKQLLNTFLLLIYKENCISHRNISKLNGSKIFIQYFGVIEAILRPILLIFELKMQNQGRNLIFDAQFMII